jgi:hypothetical protein
MRHLTLPAVIAVVGVALGGCGSSGVDSLSPVATLRRTPVSAATPLTTKDATIVAAVTAIPAGRCRARHVAIADPQGWEPDPACTPEPLTVGWL